MSTSDETLDEQQPASGGRNGPSAWLVLFGVVAVGTGIFILQNGESVPAEFLWFDAEIKLWVAIVASVCLGVVLDRLILTWWRRARRRDD